MKLAEGVSQKLFFWVEHHHKFANMVDGYRRLVEKSPPASSAQSPLKNSSATAHHMLLGFIAGISTVMAVAALLCCLFGTKVIPLLKQHRTFKGELHLHKQVNKKEQCYMARKI